ncbi:MAG TPA: GNAT family N-acetyltransferase [Acidobacteriaceae bacterium]|nr:GNAT family N-acetyltransferase [Acidobacteriaceae bacterium]
MQFDARSRSWQAAYPDAIDSIVVCDGQPIGRRLVAGVSEGSHLIDVALLAPWRNRGIGSLLLRQLMEECAVRQHPLSLHVLDGSPAQRLYARMGFEKTETSQIYIVMQWTPGVRELSQRLPAR